MATNKPSKKRFLLKQEQETMSSNEAVRFFDTSACLNLTRPTGSTPSRPKTTTSIDLRPTRKRSLSTSAKKHRQIKIDLYNFDHIDFVDSKYVLTSPRSLEACSRLNIKPMALLPKRPTDLENDIDFGKNRMSSLSKAEDHQELERLAKVQRCREEREKIIREESMPKNSGSNTRNVEPQISSFHDVTAARPSFFPTRFNPSSSLIEGLNKATTIRALPTSSEFESNESSLQRPSSSMNRFQDEENVRPSLLDDVQHLNRSLQRMSTTETGPKSQYETRYMNGLENVREMIERRSVYDPELAEFEKKQMDILRGHYDHELKIQRAQEKARLYEKRTEIERYESLLHDVQDLSMAEQRRQNEIRRKIEKLQNSRNLYETLQEKNYSQQLNDLERRKMELMTQIRQKDRRSKVFMKDKQEATNLSRTLAKSSQDLREYLRESHSNFNEMAKKAELNSSVLVGKPKRSVERRDLRSSIRT